MARRFRPTRSGDAAHGDEHERLLTGLQVADVALVGAIHPPARVGGEQVEDVVHAHLVERRELLVAHALQPVDTDRGEVAKGELAHSTPKR